jgi:hypothetical protein
MSRHACFCGKTPRLPPTHPCFTHKTMLVALSKSGVNTIFQCKLVAREGLKTLDQGTKYRPDRSMHVHFSCHYEWKLTIWIKKMKAHYQTILHSLYGKTQRLGRQIYISPHPVLQPCMVLGARPLTVPSGKVNHVRASRSSPQCQIVPQLVSVLLAPKHVYD